MSLQAKTPSADMSIELETMDIEKDANTEKLIQDIVEKARNLYLTRQMLCTEAVLTSLNRGLNGGLSDSQTVAMAAPFCIALGDSGCLCGALSGAVMGSGLILGQSHPYRRRGAMRSFARQLHNHFKADKGSTCCRVLTRKVGGDKDAHFRQCADLTAYATGMAARLILECRPELTGAVDGGFLSKRESTIGGVFQRIVNWLHG